jgi:glutamate--cysteine ligase
MFDSLSKPAHKEATLVERDRVEAFERGNGRELLLSGLWGFEREALRVDEEGRPAATDHPFPPEEGRITVDFGENQVEFITRPRQSVEEALDELEELHAQAYGALNRELLWPLSVPGRWDTPERLRPASFAGRPEKEGARRYREYLLSRYGRARQAITGLHYNFSLSPELWEFLRRAERSSEEPRAFSDRRYMDLARNFLRYRFLPFFLFAASPAIDPRFERELGASADFPSRAIAAACAGRLASLRLGPLGYRLDPRTIALVDLRYDSLDEYIAKLEAALLPTGEAAPLLRSAGEFYAPLRPKAALEGEKGSLGALRSKGIEYLELRIFDLDPFEPVGIGADAARFTQLFVLACLLMPSPPLGRGAAEDDPLTLASSSCSFDQSGGPADARLRKAVADAAREPIRAMSRIAALLPSEYGAALAKARGALEGARPRSVELFARLAIEEGGGLAAGLSLARAHRRHFLKDAT